MTRARERSAGLEDSGQKPPSTLIPGIDEERIGRNRTALSLRSAMSLRRGARARFAERAGLGRESLTRRARAEGAKPRYDTVLKVLHSLGVKLTVSVT